MKTFEQIKNKAHDASGVYDPEKWLWERIGKVYYPLKPTGIIIVSRAFYEAAQKFPRRCSYTGVGMNQGWYFERNSTYAASRKTANEIAKQNGYKNISEFCESTDLEACYFTEWSTEDDGENYIQIGGMCYELEAGEENDDEIKVRVSEN